MGRSGIDNWFMRLFDSGKPPNTADFLCEVPTDPQLFMPGHETGVLSVAFAPDGRHVLSGSMDRTVRLLDLGTGKVVRTFTGHDDSVHAVAFSPDGRRVLSGSSDHTVRLWEAASGRPIHILDAHQGTVHDIAFGPDGRQALSASSDNTLVHWDLKRGEVIRSFEHHTDEVHSVACSGNGRYALSGSLDHQVMLRDLGDGVLVAKIKAHEGGVHMVAFSPDGRRFATGGRDGWIRIWETATQQRLHEYPLGSENDIVTSLAFSPDGQWLLITLFDHFEGESEIGLINVEGRGRRVMHEVVLAHILNRGNRIHPDADLITSIAFSPDGHWALGGTMDGALLLWPMEAITSIFLRLEPAPGT
ncbi:MAG: WD40 repeat domain-containing protein [Pseudomonadota bacterium]